jgi:tRNA-dihydrouridine synthase B
MGEFLLMLAPIEGYTDSKFRKDCFEAGADLTFTEMARVVNLAKGKRGELEKIMITEGVPTQIQLAGAKISEYERFLDSYEPQKGFCDFNLNLGCPSPGFIKQGLGAAMMKRTGRIKEIVKLIEDYGYSCSLKFRLGLNKFEKEKKVYMNLIEKVDASFYILHARTAEQTDEKEADFSDFAQCIETGKKIVANGGIKTKKQVDEFRELGAYGVMIGGAAIDNAQIFRDLK